MEYSTVERAPERAPDSRLGTSLILLRQHATLLTVKNPINERAVDNRLGGEISRHEVSTQTFVDGPYLNSVLVVDLLSLRVCRELKPRWQTHSPFFELAV